MALNLKALVDQVTPTVLAEGGSEYLAQSKLGQLFTADWQTRLVLAGKAYTVDLGAGGTGLTGNAAFDADQPEFVLSVTSGWLIPMEINIDIHTSDDDAYNDVIDIDFIVDRSQAQASATATAETPNNLLDGGDAFGGHCWSIVTANITAPVESDVLCSMHYTLLQVAAETAGTARGVLGLHKTFSIPRFIAGPCQIIGYVTGTNTPTFMGSVIFAHLPLAWVTTS